MKNNAENESGGTYAINAEFDFASILLVVLAIALQRHIGALTLAHGLRPLECLRAGGANTVHTTLQGEGKY